MLGISDIYRVNVVFVGKTSQLEFASFLSPELKKIIAAVLDRLETPIESGRHEIDENAFFMVMDDHTQLLAQRKSECHSRYLDVQVLLEGKESFGYSLLPYKGLDEDYLNDKDLAFSEQMEGEEHFAKLSAGEFIIFYPGQPHRPLVAVDDKPMPVRKVVIKVDKALFA